MYDKVRNILLVRYCKVIIRLNNLNTLVIYGLNNLNNLDNNNDKVFKSYYHILLVRYLYV